MFNFIKNMHPKMKAGTVGSFASGVAVLAAKQFLGADISPMDQMLIQGAVTGICAWIWPSTK